MSKINFLKISTHKKRAIIFALLVGLVGSYIILDTSAASPNPNNQFYIVGNKIIGPDSKVFLPIGANLGITSGFDWNGTANGHSDAAVAWGWNTIRLNIYCTSSTSYSLVKAATGDAPLIAEVDKVVAEYTAKKIVVMLACHDSQLNPPEAARFWTNIGNKYKTNPYVWFNYTNESGWDNSDGWVADQKAWLKTVRATGAENIFVADVMNAGQDAGWAGAKRVTDPTMGPAIATGQCNVLFAMHNYGGIEDNLGSRTYWQQVNDLGLAMVVGEFGYTFDNTDVTEQNHRGAYAVMDAANDYGIGMLVWHATHGDKFYLNKPDVNNQRPTFYSVTPGTQLTELGERFWRVSRNQPDKGYFVGNYADSKCASAQSATTTPSPMPAPSPTPTPGVISAPDLVVTDLTWSPAAPGVGTQTTFRATIKNQGTAATVSGTTHGVGFLVDGVPVTFSAGYSTSLAPGESVTLTADGGPNSTNSNLWTATQGSHNITAFVDDVNRIVESDESNNQLVKSMTVAPISTPAPVSGGPDLTVTDLTWNQAAPVVDAPIAFKAVITNRGNLPTPANTIHGVGFFVDGVQVSYHASQLDAIPAGGSVTLTAEAGPNGTSTWRAVTGNHTVLAFVDDLDRIVETNETNNKMSKTISVSATPATIPAPTVSINSPANGARVSKNVTISVSTQTPESIQSLEIYIDGKLFASTSGGSLTTVWSTSGRRVAVGTHTITARAVGLSGSTGETTIKVFK